MNTYSSIIASVISTFAVSAMSNKDGKIHIDHIQNAALAGGVSIGKTRHYIFTSLLSTGHIARLLHPGAAW